MCILFYRAYKGTRYNICIDKMVKVIDSFLYNGEPIVKYRLRMLELVVDEFIIVESRYTHSGIKKEFMWYEKHSDVFAPYAHKIRFVEIKEFPSMPSDWFASEHWWREHYQRDIIAEHVDTTQPCILICSDADELPNPDTLKNPSELYAHMSEPIFLQMKFFYYNLTWLKDEVWDKGFIVSDKFMKKHPLSVLRCHFPKQYALTNAGWHCGYFFSVKDLRRKIESFAHQEFNFDQYKNDAHVQDCIQNGKDIFMRENADMQKSEERDLPPYWEEIQQEMKELQSVTSW